MVNATVRVLSAGALGLDARLVEVEVAPSRGTIHFQVIGMPDSAVRESAHRVLSALTTSDLPIPRGPILINLAPAATRKQGAALDLAMALAVTTAGGALPPDALKRTLVLGELALDGKVRPAGRAFLAGTLAARENLDRILCPRSEAPELALAAPGVEVWGVEQLSEAVALLLGLRQPQPLEGLGDTRGEGGIRLDLADVRGQARAVRALLVAAAGGHHLLLVGPPGAGKSFLAVRLPPILPALGSSEQMEVTRIRSAAGLPVTGLARERPFRAPHHTVSYAGLVGGGPDPRPGEVTLAHRGVLFLDELAEFERRTLEVLRQPLEEGKVHLSRARGATYFPARFQLVAAMNPCPCGFLGHPTRPCHCLPRAVASYQGRVSGPLLDRLDLRVWVPPVAPEDLVPEGKSGPSRLTSDEARSRVVAARRVQALRLAGTGFSVNAEIPSPLLDRYSPLGAAERKLLLEALRSLGLTARGLIRVRRVARTLADLDESEEVKPAHLLEALAFRGEERFGLS